MNRWKSVCNPGRWACGLALALCCSVGGASICTPGCQRGTRHGRSVCQQTRRPQTPSRIGRGVAVSPDGALWLAGLDGCGRLFVQNAPAPQGTAPCMERAARAGHGGDAISADGENHQTGVWPQGTVLIAYTQPLAAQYGLCAAAALGGRGSILRRPSQCMPTARSSPTA